MLPTRLWKILSWFAETFFTGVLRGDLVQTICIVVTRKVTSLIYAQYNKMEMYRKIESRRSSIEGLGRMRVSKDRSGCSAEKL